MVRSIPPKTMLRKRRKPEAEGATGKQEDYELKVYRKAGEGLPKPREWVYETKPVFRKVRGPLVDVFREAEEVRVVIDLSGFKRGEVDIDMKPDRFVIKAVKLKQAFREEIVFPKDVDTGKVEERFKNGILEIVLPRKSEERRDG